MANDGSVRTAAWGIISKKGVPRDFNFIVFSWYYMACPYALHYKV